LLITLTNRVKRYFQPCISSKSTLLDCIGRVTTGIGNNVRGMVITCKFCKRK
jgi:hypothetical protein